MNQQQQFFARLFRDRYHSLYSFFLRKLECHEDAADSVQETFARLINHPSTAKLEFPHAYIYRIAQNLAIDVLRHRTVKYKYMESTFPEEQAGPSPTPEAILDAKKQREVIKQAIHDLPPRCREVFVLHQMKNLTYEETAKHLKISPNTAKNHYAKALLKLRAALADIRKT